MSLRILSGKDVLVDVGTGYGKTICMIEPKVVGGMNRALAFGSVGSNRTLDDSPDTHGVVVCVDVSIAVAENRVI